MGVATATLHPSCVAAQASVKALKALGYTVEELRSCLGEAFARQFWPMFQMFNCVLPAHAPMAEAGRAEGLAAFMGSA